MSAVPEVTLAYVWSENDSLYEVKPGEAATAIYTASSGINPSSMSYSTETGNLILADYNDPSTLLIVSKDGSLVRSITMGVRTVAVAYHPGQQRIFYISYVNGDLYSINEDGTGSVVEKDLTSGTNQAGLVIDATGNTGYYTKKNTGEVWEIDLSTFAESVIYDGTVALRGIALDESAGTLYLCESDSDRVTSINDDGTGYALEFTVAGNPWYIALNDDYLWVGDNTSGALVRVSRANGSKSLTSVPSPYGIAVI